MLSIHSSRPLRPRSRLSRKRSRSSSKKSRSSSKRSRSSSKKSRSRSRRSRSNSKMSKSKSKRSRSRSRSRFGSKAISRFGPLSPVPSYGSSYRRFSLPRILRKLVRRRRRIRKIKKRCYRPGIVTRNPFFNFLRDYRKKVCGKSVIQIAVDGARIWNRMSENQKCIYMQQAHCAPRRKRRSRKK